MCMQERGMNLQSGRTTEEGSFSDDTNECYMSCWELKPECLVNGWLIYYSISQTRGRNVSSKMCCHSVKQYMNLLTG